MLMMAVLMGLNCARAAEGEEVPSAFFNTPRDVSTFYDIGRSVLEKYPDYHYFSYLIDAGDSAILFTVMAPELYSNDDKDLFLSKYGHWPFPDSYLEDYWCYILPKGGYAFEISWDDTVDLAIQTGSEWHYKVVPMEPFVYTLDRGSLIFSDLNMLPDLRENREEVTYLHAQTVILASFVLFALFRRLWFSIRGRVD